VPARAFGSYTQEFNRAYERSGTLFEGPYRARAVEADSYFVTLCGYIHLNAVHHGIVDRPGDWPYSNYLEWIGGRQGSLVVRELVRETFSTPQDYEAFVQDLRERYTFQEAAFGRAWSFQEG
jgi:hypothetical protein